MYLSKHVGWIFMTDLRSAYLGFVSLSGSLGSSLHLFQNVMLTEFGITACMYCLSVCEADLYFFDK